MEGRNSIGSSGTMHTREKIGTLCKRCLKYFYEKKKEIISINKAVHAMSAFTSDYKKIFDLIFVLEGIGLLTRISKNNLIFTGFKGMTAKLNEVILRISQKRTNTIPEHIFFCDELTIEDKKYNFKPSLYLGLLLHDIICSLLLSSNKNLSRNEIDLKVEYYTSYCKEIFIKGFNIIDLINLLVSMNFVEKNEQMESISWIGPDCINSSGITKDHIHLLSNFEKIFKSSNQDLNLKEANFFNYIFKEIEEKKEKKDNKIKIEQNSQIFPEIIEEDKKKNEVDSSKTKENLNAQMIFPVHITKFSDKNFAILKFKSWKYQMKKLQVIIGRNPSNKEIQKNKNIKWLSDVDLSSAKRVSRQHAIILYNFQDKTFEIKCLSKKFPIKVDGNYSTHRDKAVPLTVRTLITIGTESFYFLQALPTKPEEIDEKKLDSEIKAEENTIKEETRMDIENIDMI